MIPCPIAQYHPWCWWVWPGEWVIEPGMGGQPLGVSSKAELNMAGMLFS